ncbi:MAG: PEP-CTERM sorting domain-containing protein, partial [Pirellulales bacterium]
VVNTGWPISPSNGGPWVPNGNSSRWIAPRAEQNQAFVDPSFGNQPGLYTMETTFDLTGFIPASAEVEVHLWADNQVNDVVLNGVSLGLTAPSFDNAGGRFYVVNGPFVPSVNTLEFVWENLPPNLNPAGLRVELSGRALVIPEPSSFGIAGLCLALALVWRRRRA